MARRVLIVLCFSFMIVLMASCGQTYKLESITVLPVSPNLEGIGSSQALTISAHYSNTKSQDVTVKSHFQVGASQAGETVAPLTAVSVSASGIVKAVDGACTWDATLLSDGTTFGYATAPYTVTVTYSGFTTQAFVSVASAAACYDGQLYKAPVPTKPAA